MLQDIFRVLSVPGSIPRWRKWQTICQPRYNPGSIPRSVQRALDFAKMRRPTANLFDDFPPFHNSHLPNKHASTKLHTQEDNDIPMLQSLEQPVNLTISIVSRSPSYYASSIK